MKRPNIVYFVADQLRSDALGVHGNPAAITPNLDAFATHEAVTFTNAYCQNPVCVPSRNSFLSGLYPHTKGHRTMHFLADEDDPNILKVMKQEGYEVIWCGRNDVVPANKSKAMYCDEYYDGRDQLNKVEPVLNQDHSFKNLHPSHVEIGPDLYSFYLGEGSRDNPFVAMDWNTLQSALDYLDRRAASPSDKPFFLYVTLWFPHPPYTVEKPWYNSTDRSNLPKRRPSALSLKNKASMLTEIARKQGLDVWDEAKFDELRATYLDMVSRFDHHFGLLVNKLKETQQYENTNLFLFSDHGDLTTDYSIAEKAQNLFENPISNVPLMVKPASSLKVKPGKNEALVELLDLSATVADMAGFELPYTQFGKSLVEAIAGNPLHKDAVFCEGGRIHGEKQAMELGHIETSPYYPRLSTQYSEGPEHTKAIMIRMENFKYTYRLYELDEFYDLKTDPYELNNVIVDPAYAPQIEVMRDRLLKHMIETGDFVPNRRDPR